MRIASLFIALFIGSAIVGCDTDNAVDIDTPAGGVEVEKDGDVEVDSD